MKFKPDTPIPLEQGVATKPKPTRLAVSIGLAVLFVAGMVLGLFGNSQQAFAASTTTDDIYIQLYDSDGNYSHISRLGVDGSDAYCMEFNSEFASGVTVTAHDAASVVGQPLVTKVTLLQDYVNSISWLSAKQKYFISQALVWEALNPGSFTGGLRTECGVSDQNQINIKNEAYAYYQKYATSYVGHGTYWSAGSHQDLAQFWIERHTLGSLKLKKVSSNPSATNGNSRYSLAGAIYTIYNSDGKAVGTLTVDANGDSNTVSNLWAGEFGYYTIKETTPPKGYQKNTTTYSVHLTSDGQVITVNVSDPPILGSIELYKSSANTDITNGNACYRLNGAQYGIYKTAADAQNQTGRFASLTTNAQGYGSVGNLPLNEYYVREYKAPEGYAIDNTIYFVDITAGNTTVKVLAQDKPKNDPIGALLQKADNDTGLPYAGSGSASLKDAQFTIKYYDGQYATVADAESSGAPTRTWVLKTDEDGFVGLHPDYLVSGDALYFNSAGDATIPLGTFTLQETKAPVGYLLSTPTLPNTTRIFHITDTGTDGEFVYVYNQIEVREQVARGDIELVKYQEDEITTPDLPSELKTPEVGVTFDLYASRDFTGNTPNSGAVPALSLVTDSDGVASTIATGQVLIQWPDGSYTTRPRTPNDAGCLPYDSYLVIQRDAPFGYSSANPFVVSAKENNVKHTYIVGNTLIPAAIQIVKCDSETGEAVPLPAKWQVLDVKTGKPIAMTIHYPKTVVLDTFESSEDGWLLLPEMLPMGSYLLHEVEAPHLGNLGYLLNPVDVPFEVTQRYEWDNPLVVTCKDAPAKGQIALAKSDSLDGSPVAGATYEVYAASDVYTLDGTLRYQADELVDTLVTDGSGEALSKDLYLGSYYVVEVATPDGYALNTTRYAVELAYIDQITTVNIEDVDAVDKPTTVKVLKVEAGTEAPLAGVTFAFEDENGYTVEFTTGEDGYLTYNYLPQGSYKVYEVATLPGYILNTDVIEITVDENGWIDGSDTCELLFTNDFTKVVITKTDIVTGEPVIGATLQIFPVDEEGDIVDEPLYEWVTTEEPYFIERLPQGDYILREHTAPAGYVIAQDIAFTVEDTGDIQAVDMIDDITRIDIAKVRSDGGSALAGAKLQIIDEDGKVVYEWVSTDESYLIERLPQGDYILREVEAPEGYDLAEDVKFTVLDTTDVQMFSMTDVKIVVKQPETPKLDQTGNDMTGTYVIAGMFILAGIAGAVLIARNIRSKGDSDEDGSQEG
jgi:uncharacterized surface anchored protein